MTADYGAHGPRPEWADYMLGFREIDGRYVGLIPLIGGRARIIDNCDAYGYGAFW